MKKAIVFSSFFMLAIYLSAQQVDLSAAASQVKNIAATAAGVIGGIVGLIGIGRAAYKFASGDTDAVTALLTGIVGLVLGQIAAGLL